VLTGTHPFAAPAAADTLHRILHEAPPRPSQLVPSLGGEFERRLRPWHEIAALRTWAWVASRPALYAIATRIGNRVLRSLADRNGMIRKLPLAGGWTDERDMPAPAGRTFRELYAARARTGAASREPAGATR
jgi:L-lactate dehydrogenase complex protein LldF